MPTRAVRSTVPIHAIQGLGYRADVDGLRGVAILFVILYHVGFQPLSGGYSGVDIFFVISGYLIGFQVLRELQQQSFALLPFLERRARRILPPLLLVVVGSLLAGWVLMNRQEMHALGEQAGAATISLSNLYYWKTTSYFSSNAHLQTLLMTWSLGIEMQFYVLLPLIATMFYRRSKRTFLRLMLSSLILSLIYAARGLHDGLSGSFFLLPARWWELAAGVVLASVEVQSDPMGPLISRTVAEVCGVAGLLGLVVSMRLPEPRAQFLLPPACISVVASLLICLSPESWVNRNLLSSKLVSFFGRRSYSIYLWHWPLLSFGYLCGAGCLAPKGRLTLLALTLCFAEISYRYVELPFRTARGNGRAIHITAGVAAAVFSMSATLILMRAGSYHARLRSVVENSIRSETTVQTCLMGDFGTLGTIPSDCVPPNSTVALIGDSHAASLAKGLLEISPKIGLLMKSSCAPLLGVTIRSPGPDRCSTFERDVLSRVAAENGVSTVVVAGYWLNPAYDASHEMRYVRVAEYAALTTEEQSWIHFHDGLLAMCLALQAAHKKVVLVEDVPILLYDPHLLAVGKTRPVRTRLGLWLASVPARTEREPHERTQDEARMHDILQDVAARSMSKIVSLYQPLCDGATCQMMASGMPLFEDRQHLSTAGARLLLRPSGLADALSSPSVDASPSTPELLP